ncbi:MAG: PLP-dependent aminotransferase family protein [Acidobacteriia bacterium]|nr:PLP-dependent aminotransferase family protein [Terriglobia bacterium]
MVPFLALHLDRRSSLPLQRQLYDEIRAAILSGRLAPGVRLPATRGLAADARISRNTVCGAFDQLLAEGYLEGKAGSGTYVAKTLPEELLRVTRQAMPARAPRVSALLSQRGRLLAATRTARADGIAVPHAFQPGVPAFDQFPRVLWARMAARILRHAPAALLTYGEPAGYRPLRQAIAEYLRAARGVRCSADQVIVTSGSQQALDLAARVLLDPGDAAWVEDPGYLGARAALLAAGVRCVPVPIDSEGLSVAAGEARAPNARLACVTPSHQYPLGVTMPLGRRMKLLDWARRSGAWIVEDDYDSEFRYAGRPLPALQGLDTAGRVVYTGTFSKVLLPALRLGYLVPPEPLVDAFVSARALADRHSPALEQALTAEFLSEGYFGRHVRRMRALYAERQEALVAAARNELAGLLEVEPAEAGLQLVGWLPKSLSDRAVSERAAKAGIIAAPISAYAMQAKLRPGLRLGYAPVNPRQIRDGVLRLAAVLATTAAGAS